MTLSPLVDALRLESVVRKQRARVTKLAEQLADAELVRALLERELEAAREDSAQQADPNGGASCAASGTPNRRGTSSAGNAATRESPHRHESPAPLHPAQPDDGVGAPTRSQGRVDLGQVVPGHAPGGVPTTPDPSAPNAGGDACAESARTGASTRRGVAAGETASTSAGSGASENEPPAAPGSRRVNRCSLCGLPGHKSTTCNRERKPDQPKRRGGGSAVGKHAIDETGHRYGKLSVIEPVVAINGNARWRCGCDCGGSFVALGADLRAGRVTCCPECRPAAKHCSKCGQPGHRANTCDRVDLGRSEPTVGPDEKRCIQCKLPKPRTEFYAHHTAKDGLQSRCKSCDNNTRVVRSGGIPGNPPGPRPKPCKCHGMPSRVEGERCSDCGLEAEKPLRATDFTGSASAIARAS